MLKNTKGFCFHHYAELLKNAKHAGGATGEYCKLLAEIEEANLRRMTAELQWFCDKHDYRNREKPLGTSADALPRSRTKFYGKKPYKKVRKQGGLTMKTAIYGAGSLGTVLGAYVTKAGYPIDLINRNAPHVEALKKNGAHIVGTVEMTVPVSALLPKR